MKKLYNEFKSMVRSSYSVTCRHFDSQFKQRSVEGFVRINEEAKEKEEQRKIEIQKANNRKLGHMLDQMCIKMGVNNNKYLSDNSNGIWNLYKDKHGGNAFINDKIKILNNASRNMKVDENKKRRSNLFGNTFNLDEHLSDIFRFNGQLKMGRGGSTGKASKSMNDKNEDKNLEIEKIKRMLLRKHAFDKEKIYFPNFNSIFPHTPDIFLDNCQKTFSIKPEVKFPKLCKIFYHKEKKINRSPDFNFVNNKFNKNLFYSLVESKTTIPKDFEGDKESRLIIPGEQIESDGLKEHRINKLNNIFNMGVNSQKKQIINNTTTKFTIQETEKKLIKDRIRGNNIGIIGNSRTGTKVTNNILTNNTNEDNKSVSSFRNPSFVNSGINSVFTTLKQ